MFLDKVEPSATGANFTFLVYKSEEYGRQKGNSVGKYDVAVPHNEVKEYFRQCNYGVDVYLPQGLK